MKKSLAPGLRTFIFSFLFLIVLAGCGTTAPAATGTPGTTPTAAPVTLNLGYFPNLTHSVALVGVGNGTLTKFAPNVTVNTTTFNAGPAEMTALLSGSIDIAFVGPSPAVNAYTQSQNSALKVIAGASSAGVEFVVQGDGRIKGPADLAGKTIADPSKGGTQDVALRNYLQKNGLKPADKGGNVNITSTDNATILNLFKQGQVDGAWMPEPWATRLVVEGKGKVLVDEKTLWPSGQFATTIVVVRQDFLKDHPDTVKEFLEAEIKVVQYIKANPADAAKTANNQITKLTGSGTQASELNTAFNNVTLTYDPLVGTITEQANRSYALGFVTTKPDLSQFYDLGPLNDALTAQKLPKVATS